MGQQEMKVSLLAAPLTPAVAVLAARGCYSGDSYEDMIKKLDDSPFDDKVLMNVIDSGHLSVLEHLSFTFSIEGVSRALLAQLTRHRIASFSVESQRYVNQGNEFKYVVPPSIESLDAKEQEKFHAQMRIIGRWYQEWIDVLGNKEDGRQDARFVLPNACATKLVMTMNARELFHFFQLRCCNRAQWEIRELANQMLALCKAEFPDVFRKAGAPCEHGACPESSKSCGSPIRRG